MTNIFDGKGRIPEKLQIIGGATDVRGQKMNDDSLDDLNFFDKPVEEFVEKNDMGFKKVIQKEPLKRIDSDKDEDSASNSNSFAKKPAKSEFFNPVAQYRQEPRKGKERENIFNQTPEDSSEHSSANTTKKGGKTKNLYGDQPKASIVLPNTLNVPTIKGR